MNFDAQRTASALTVEPPLQLPVLIYRTLGARPEPGVGGRLLWWFKRKRPPKGRWGFVRGTVSLSEWALRSPVLKLLPMSQTTSDCLQDAGLSAPSPAPCLPAHCHVLP